MYQIANANNFEQIITINKSQEIIDETCETFSKIIIEQKIVTKNGPPYKRLWTLVPNTRLVLDVFKNKISLRNLKLSFEHYIQDPSKYEKILEVEIIQGFTSKLLPKVTHALDPDTNIYAFFEDIETDRDKQFFIRSLLSKINKNILSEEYWRDRLKSNLKSDELISCDIENISIRNYIIRVQNQQFGYSVNSDWAICEAVALLNIDVINHLAIDGLIAEQILKGNIERK